MQKISPFLWFNDQAEGAAKFYVSLFKDSRIEHIARYSGPAAKAAGRPEGSAMTVVFYLNGQKFIALNGGSQYNFTPAISFAVTCESQAEIDRLWKALTDGGEEVKCGWLRDRYGLSWQIVPDQMGKWMTSPKASKVMQAILGMTKLDIAILEKAAA